MDGNDKYTVSPLLYDNLKKFGDPWVRKAVLEDFYPRFGNEGATWVDSKGVRQTHIYYYHAFADAYDGERRMASQTSQTLANACKEKVYLTYWLNKPFL